MPTGEIEPRQVEVLNGIGQWLRNNGESIYGTRGGPFKPSGDVFCTRHGNKVYLHVLKWNGDTVVIPALPRKLRGSKVLTGGDAKIEQTDLEWALRVPADQQEIDTIIMLELDGSVEDIPAIDLPKANAVP